MEDLRLGNILDRLEGFPYKAFSITVDDCPVVDFKAYPIFGALELVLKTKENDKKPLKSPYKDKEKIIADALVLAWNVFAELEKMHPSEINDFADGIHKCQSVLGMRTLRRDYPETYPVKK